jgi:pimeloyl-ACP methyl ester carboxylesterase
MGKKIYRKGRGLRITLRILLGLMLFIIIACFVFDQLVQFRMSDKELTKVFRENNVKGKIGYYTSHGRKIRYVLVNNDTLPALIFLHGSPSSLSIYKHHFLDSTFKKMFHVIAVDRPGYGYSGFGDPEPSIQKQSEMIRPLLDSIYKLKKPVILVGSSYGSSIASRLVMDHPELVDGLVLIAPSLAPGEEKMYWITPYIESPLLYWMLPRMFKSANTEKLAHKAELEKMLPYWKNIRVPVMYMQGEKDELVYTSNAEFARKQLVNVKSLDITFFKGRPHFVPFAEKAGIKKKILEMYDQLTSKPSDKPLAN